MVYFENNLIKFPNHFNQIVSKIKFINELSDDIIEVDVEDHSDNVHFYEFDMTNVVLKNGTYRYEFGKEVGLMQVGDYIVSVYEYNEKKDNIVYEG